MHRSAATIVSRDVALAADETIGLSSVSASRSTPAAQSRASRTAIQCEPKEQYAIQGQVHSARRVGRPRGIAAFCKQTNKQTNKETSCTGTQRRALVAHVRVDHGRDALEAAVTEQRLDVQPIARVAEAAGIKASRNMQQPCSMQHALWPRPILFEDYVSPKDGSAAVARQGFRDQRVRLEARV
jgi:hypothetical protein